MAFSPQYVAYVLNENFEDAKALFLSPLMAIHYAHLIMLTDQGIVPPDDAHRLRLALDGISPEDVRRVVYDGTCEDLFFYIERLIVDSTDEESAGRLHTARSRNDIDMTMYRMRQREFILGVLSATQDLRRSLLDIADRHRDTVFAAHTHTQPAQPTTVGHYMLAAIEQLERDADRLRAAYDTTNRCPLGACAITGTGFPIDRHCTSDLLGFLGPTGNTYGSIATVDYLLQSVSVTAVALAGIGRLVQDFLLWCTAEFDYMRLGDGFVQCSSIMPQKRNPVALEHARAIASKALGQAQAIFLTLHNTPFGDIVDTEDDLQPLVASMFRDATRAIQLTAAVMGGATLNKERLEERAGAGWITVTELADTLTREHRLPFKTSHDIAQRLVAFLEQHPETPMAHALATVSREALGVPIEYSAEQLLEILSPQHFVAVRRTLGGPSPDVTGPAVAASKEVLRRDDEWIARTGASLTDAQDRLQARARAL